MDHYFREIQTFSCQDELTNAMVEQITIISKDVERAFRCVDRRIYFTDDEKSIAYKNAAWQSEYIHLSSPSNYASVLESLQLQPGQKFLNIGSGIGYMNTVAGLLLGTYGINHGIEVNQPIIDLALQKLNEFMSNAAAIDYYNFCEPVFIHGNACQLMASGYYDRIYCNYRMPPSESLYIKSLIKVNGVLVMQTGENHIKFVRKSKHTWKVYFLGVLFSVKSNVLDTPDSLDQQVKLPSNVLSLQDLCRFSIRSLLRENLKIQSPELKIRTKIYDEIDQESDCVSYTSLFWEPTSDVSLSNFLDVEENRLINNEDAARDLIKYRFTNLCTVNKLSIRMKKKIDSLPIPTPLKNFLNYFRYN